MGEKIKQYLKCMCACFLMVLFFSTVGGTTTQVMAADDGEMRSGEGYFYVKIVSPDGNTVSTQRVDVTYDGYVRSDSHTKQQKVTFKLHNSSKNNSHKIAVNGIKSSNTGTYSQTQHGKIGDITKALGTGDGGGISSTCPVLLNDGTVTTYSNANKSKIVAYEEDAYTIFEVAITYDKPAYTYATSGGASGNYSAVRFNTSRYTWYNKSDSTLNKMVYNKVNRETFYLQINMTQTGVFRPGGVTEDYHATYTIQLENPKLTISYDGNGATSGTIDKTLTVAYTSDTGDSADPHNFSTFGLEKTNYIRYDGAEWNTKKNGTGTSFDQDKTYTALQFKAQDFDSGVEYNSSSSTWKLKLYAQWVAQKFEIRYYMNAPVTIADTDSWTVANSFTLLGNSSAESANKNYTGAQIKKTCGNKAPYMYKTYTCGNYYTAPQSSSIKISGYNYVISGTHTKNGWWTAASGGTYIDIDGATSGDNAGKISATDLWQYAVDGTLSDGTKGKIVSLYAHWAVQTYEIRYYVNAPRTLTDADSWKIYTGDHLIGKSSAETATVTYTGTQINSACGSNQPYVYRRYTCGTYISAPQSSNVKVNGYKVVINGTHTKNGWWTAANGGIYVNVDGATSGDNAGKISATDLWQYAVDGTLSDGTKGKIVSLYAHWEKSSFKVTLTAGTGVESVSGAGEYAAGDEVKISADLLTGYHWLNWTGNYGSGTIADQMFTFTMPAQDVTLTANAEINSYTLHFDPNTGTEVTHIDDMEVTYDGQITLPDATGCYARYTLDGQDITSQVISGEIRLAADGRVLTGDEEETEDTEESDTETTDIEESDTEAADTELELETEQKAAEATKKAYASVYTGWSLEDGKTDYTPQWSYGIQMDVAKIIDAAGLTDADGATITLYANWDDCPWIVANDLYYTLEQAQSGFITMDEILSHATASDREDGSPIFPGTNPTESDPELFTSFTIPDYLPTDFTQFTHEGSCTENLTVTDSAGSTYVKQITVYVVDTTPVAVKAEGTTRFINEYYYNQPYEYGGLEDDSIWKTDAEYVAAIQEAFSNLNNNTPEESYYFTHETVLEMKQFIEENGFGNLQSADALTRFYNQFMEPNKQ